MKSLSIGELSRRTAAPASAIRYYERIGVLPRPGRVNGRRLYDQGAIARVNVLRFAQQAGFSLKDIRDLFGNFGSKAGMGTRWRALAARKLQELEDMSRRIEEMRRAIQVGMKCGCIRIEECTLSPDDLNAGPSGLTQAGCSRNCG